MSERPESQMRRVVGRTCSRPGCYGPLDLLTARSVLWCSRCRSVQVQERGEGRIRVKLEDWEEARLTLEDSSPPVPDGRRAREERVDQLVERAQT